VCSLRSPPPREICRRKSEPGGEATDEQSALKVRYLVIRPAEESSQVQRESAAAALTPTCNQLTSVELYTCVSDPIDHAAD
jgi:hypothetical protein